MDSQSSSLADVLERVLDKGVVIVGDIAVNVVDIELLTLRLRLFIASAQTAREMGMDWWTNDPFFSPGAARAKSLQADAQPAGELDELRSRVRQLETALQTSTSVATSEPTSRGEGL
ncbi:gas vesicle protein [Amycolatopsis sp. NPDC051758]|uniref:gas vesicle protein n=1 Tax=Amycolatopsis sp. NPDC051758 TaxID=3363935 RepID=UPI0037B41DE0